MTISNAPDRNFRTRIIWGKFSQFLHKTFTPFFKDYSSEGLQHKLKLLKKKGKTLQHYPELQISEGIKDNSKAIFLISK